MEHASLFIRPQRRRVLGSGGENHHQQPTMRVFNSAGAGDPGHRGFPPSSSSAFLFRLNNCCSRSAPFVGGGGKIDDPSRRCPSARPRHQREIDGQRIQTRSARLRPACLLFEGGCRENERPGKRGVGVGGFCGVYIINVLPNRVQSAQSIRSDRSCKYCPSAEREHFSKPAPKELNNLP